jgi:hypothetical protein
MWFLLLVSSVADAACYGNASPGSAQLFKTTGNPQLDQAINAEASALATAFGVTPQLYTMNDSGSPNAISQCGRVLIGLTLLQQELWSMEKGAVAVAGVMAHEWTHELQCTKGSSLSVQQKELQADYLAGTYLKWRGHISTAAIEGFARSLYEKGDYNFWDPQHHGTPQQRVEAMLEGFANGGTINSAYAASLAWVSEDQDDSPQCTTTYTVCSHPAHEGHIIVCQHPIATTQPGPCLHACYTPYGMMRCHPADPYPVVVPAHPNGDIVECAHPAHPQGDPKQVCY